MEVRSRSIICSWVSVATATLQISTSRLPCRKPAFQAYPNGSTSATMPSKLTWKPSWPRPFLRKVISVVSQPRVTIWSKTERPREKSDSIYYRVSVTKRIIPLQKTHINYIFELEGKEQRGHSSQFSLLKSHLGLETWRWVNNASIISGWTVSLSSSDVKDRRSQGDEPKEEIKPTSPGNI